MNIARLLRCLSPLFLLAIASPWVQPAAAQGEPKAQPSSCQTKAKNAPETIAGTVELVQGSILTVRLADQKLRRVEVPEAQGVDLGFLLGQRVVIQQQACYLPPRPPIPQGW
jgi:hypothetical protein